MIRRHTEKECTDCCKDYCIDYFNDANFAKIVLVDMIVILRLKY